MRPRLLQDLRRRDRRLRDLRLRDLHHLKKALQVSHQARSLPMLPNLKLEEMKDSEDDFYTDSLLPPSFMVRYIRLTLSGLLDYKLYFMTNFLLGAEEAENPETSWVEEAANVGDLDLGNLDISSVQDQFYDGLDESNLGFQQPSARGQAYLCETPETSYDSFFNL